ncbi:MAG: hypothetical protein WBX25_24820 [Rhodomicrobium sp.]
MKVAALILALMAAASGLWAAFKWYRASHVHIVAFDERDDWPVPTPDVEARLTALSISLQRAGRINKEAAFWTAVSIGLTGLSAVAAALVHS